MIRLTDNRLLWVTIAVAGAFWGIGPLVPGNILSGTISLYLIVFGVVTLLRYGEQSWHIVVRGRRSPDQDGAHLAAYGVSLLALGSVWSGLFRLLWLAFDTPSSWLLTVFSSFGSLCMASGFALLFFSPDLTREGLRVPIRLWAIALVVAAMIIVLFVGVQIGRQQAVADDHLISYGSCPAAEPVKGNRKSDGRRIYHTRDSPWYGITMADDCFANEAAARVAGYRPPG